MEEWQRVASEKEEDGLEKKSVDSRNDYGDSNEDSYQQQILEKTRLAFAAHAAQQLTNDNDSNSDTQQILKNPGDNCSAFIATQSKRDGTPKQIKEELEDSANTQDRYLDYHAVLNHHSGSQIIANRQKRVIIVVSVLIDKEKASL